jgi:hypothetical protein
VRNAAGTHRPTPPKVLFYHILLQALRHAKKGATVMMLDTRTMAAGSSFIA